MPIPGHPVNIELSGRVTYDTTTQDVDVFADAGSPSAAQDWLVVVESGVTIDSSDPSIPAFDMSGFPAGTRVVLVQAGLILGAGGAGGQGAGSSGTSIGGGGGGGAGSVVGAGGLGGGGTGGNDGTDGAAHPSTTAGTGGTGTNTGGTFVGPTAGEAGGDAISSGSVELIIDNTGSIWGGGGGGGGTDGSSINGNGGDGGDGGAPGVAGSAGTNVPGVFYGTAGAGGAGGYAVRGSDVTFRVGGSSPDVEGTVGT